MPWRKLVLTAPLLMVAARPLQCGQAPAPGEQPVVPLDLAGQPLRHTPLVSTSVAVSRALDEAGAGIPRQGDSLRDPRADALHALPEPGVVTVSPPRPEN